MILPKGSMHNVNYIGPGMEPWVTPEINLMLEEDYIFKWKILSLLHVTDTTAAFNFYGML